MIKREGWVLKYQNSEMRLKTESKLNVIKVIVIIRIYFNTRTNT